MAMTATYIKATNSNTFWVGWYSATSTLAILQFYAILNAMCGETHLTKTKNDSWEAWTKLHAGEGDKLWI